MEIHPSLQMIEPFDARIGASVYFSYTGSKQAMENELQIVNIKTGLIVYKFEYSSFEKVHHIPPNILVNGESYQAKIRVKFSDGTYSPYSNIVHFKVFDTPVLDIISIDGQGYIYNQDVTFVAKYSQSDGERVKNYQFILLDENQDLIQTFPIRQPLTDDEFTELVKGLEKGKGYFIKCKIETINGIIYDHTEKFIPMYIVPSLNGVISTLNDEEEGFIRITSNLSQMLGTQAKAIVGDDYHSDNFEYIDGEWIVINKGDSLTYEGLNMNRASDFVLKLWCKNIPYNTKFLELRPLEGGIAIEFWRYSDRVIVVKRNNGIVSRYRSNIYNIPWGTDFMLYVKAIEHRIDVEIKII